MLLIKQEISKILITIFKLVISEALELVLLTVSSMSRLVTNHASYPPLNFLVLGTSLETQ